MQRILWLCAAIVLLVSGACSGNDDGDTTGGVLINEPESICQGVYDSVYDACLDELGSTCIGLGCLFIFGECQSRALGEAGSCCIEMTQTQEDYETCVDLLPGIDPPD